MIQSDTPPLPSDLRGAFTDGRRLFAEADLLSRSRNTEFSDSEKLLLRLLDPELVAHSSPERANAPDLEVILALEAGPASLAEALTAIDTHALPDPILALPGDLGLHVPALHEAQVEALAQVLPLYEALIPTFTAGFRFEPEAGAASLLAEALERALPMLHGREQALEAIAALWHSVGDRERARRWALTGLEECRYSPGLAILLADLETDGESTIPDEHVLDLVRDVAAVFPQWRDLQQASRTLEAA